MLFAVSKQFAKLSMVCKQFGKLFAVFFGSVDVTAARGADMPSIFSRHEKTNNASQAFEKG